jgi:hypothetical protein
LKESSNVRASIPRTSPKMIRSGLQRSFPLEFGAVRRIAVHLLELDACRIRRLPQVVEDYVLDLDINILSLT